MTRMFQQLMTGLEEVETYIAGEREGFRVYSPEVIPAAESSQAVECLGSSLRSE